MSPLAHRPWLYCIALLGAPLFGAAAAEEPVHFSRQILPILSDHCFQCHGPDEKARKADLRLDIEAWAKRKNKDGDTAIMPGKDQSTLLQRILSHDADELMPPAKANKPLQPQEIALLQRWIREGAPWGKHWAFEKLAAPAVPRIPSAASDNPIDAFVAQRLAQESLHPAPEAPRETLIRRVSLDLTGLPPAPEELDAFLADSSPNAYEKVVDRLLASSHYGERMAWDWLDAARYADTNGYQGDQERTMWPWRDWVIKAFNDNLPFDQFSLWQLAGDLLPQANVEQKLATAFCRNHMINGEGGRIPEENRVDYVMDMAETTGTVWLGLTFNCCRCHDHKFDPLTNRDYYSFFAFFNQTPVTGGGGNPKTPPFLDLPSADELHRIDLAEKEVSQIDQAIQARQTQSKEEAEWEQRQLSQAPADQWHSLEVRQAKALVQKLTTQPNHAILASGPNPDNDTYTITGDFGGLSKVTALRLEALRHPTMTSGGLARSDSGNFVLTEIEVQVHQPGEPQPHPLKIASAVASYEQNGFPVSHAFDGNSRSGWAVWAGHPVDSNQQAVFRFAEAVPLKKGAVFTITLRHDSPHPNHNLGYFRLSASDQANANLGPANSELVNALRVPVAQRNAAQRKAVTEAWKDADAETAKLVTQRAEKQKAVDALRKSTTQVMVMEDMPKPRETFALEKGIYDKPKDKVEAAVPVSLGHVAQGDPDNRLGLAKWIISSENPLPARVIVNRYWQQFFGIGLVKTPDDFGLQGERPVQPELLDYLASTFRDSGWDLKRLCKLIVMSHTYRQSSRIAPGMAERDPQNRLLARGPRFRMPSWMLRDQALAVSGLLSSKFGGPSMKPYQPSGVWEEATFGTKRYQQDHGDELYRRSLYIFWRRIVGPTILFDNAARQVCTVKVFRTNTPLQSLITLNDITYVEASRALAQRILLEPLADDHARVAQAFRRVVSRQPSEAETRLLDRALQRYQAHFASDAEAAQQLLTIGEFSRDPKLDTARLAAFTVLCSTILNLDEALNKE